MRFLKYICLGLTAVALATCVCHASGSEPEDAALPEGRVSMVASIDAIGERLEVTVLESPYTSGVHWVIVPEAAQLLDRDGRPITRADLRVGDTVEILYSGQVMMSYPPQIVAVRIRVR